jgi:ferredoxin-type protein NapH
MAKVKQLPRRQRVRKAVLFVSLLLLPITLYYMSPYLIVASAAEGVINASFILFGLLFLSALFAGRFWCGWLCPAGAMQEFGAAVNRNPARGGKLNWIKWAIWLPWVGIIAALAVSAGGYRTVEPFHMLDGGLTVNQPFWYIIFYIIIVLFLGLAWLFGRRAGCHYICWMAPFMIIGRKISNLVRGPALRLRADADLCTECGTCTRNCQMSLEVSQMVQAGEMENSECILCGQCVDGCPGQAICFTFARGS